MGAQTRVEQSLSSVRASQAKLSETLFEVRDDIRAFASNEKRVEPRSPQPRPGRKRTFTFALEDFDHTPQTWCSPRYNIRTRYLRTVYNACLYGRHKLHPRQESCSFFTWVTAAQLKEWAADAYQERMCVWLQAMDQTEAVDCFGDVGDDEVCTSVSATRRVHPSGRFSDLSQGPETFDRAHALQGRNS